MPREIIQLGVGLAGGLGGTTPDDVVAKVALANGRGLLGLETWEVASLQGLAPYDGLGDPRD